MKYEIEHKYLVNREFWNLLEKPAGTRIVQGYLEDQPEKTIRVRIMGDQGFLTIKGPAIEATRLEYEYCIPLTDAEDILREFTTQQIEKIRYEIDYAGKLWEIDKFLGANEGLFIAEIELENENDSYDKPFWLGEEVTGNPHYNNSYLVKKPFSTWQ